MHTCLPLLIAWLSLGILPVWAADPFVENTVTRIELRIPSEGMQTLRQSYFHRRMPAMSHRPKVKGSVTMNGERFEEVSIHLKGAAGSFRPIDDKPAFTVNLDKHLEGQKYQGYDLSLIHISEPTRPY